MHAPSAPTVLRYAVHGPRGDSVREVAIDGESFAERQDRGADVVGAFGPLVWYKNGAQDPTILDGDAAKQELGDASWLGLRFTHPQAGDKLDVESCELEKCTLAFAARGGGTIWIDVDRATRKPITISWVDSHDSIVSCDSLEWATDRNGSVIAAATCASIARDVGRQTTTWKLTNRERATPEWAHVASPLAFHQTG